ncbi:MAG: ABC transporter ATP-binding protein [Alphaproteobacteria bacterium]|nr:ABC transporter ATP-binding protein [Alphaproteobacteria bacterium]
MTDIGATETAAVRLQGVGKSYGSLEVVRDLNLRIDRGEFLVLLGPSGCGKSTILRLIAGIEAPSAGEIHVGGRLVNYELPRNRNAAMVFQNYALYPHMTVARNIAYPLRAARRRNLSSARIRAMTEDAARMVEITDQLEKFPDALSGGQRQRVALARALVRDPAVFLMDEPLSNLDAQLRDTMRQQLIALHRRIGKATVYVTHDQLEAMTMADRIVVLDAGVVQQDAAPEEIFRRPAGLFVAGFVGHPKMNFFPGTSLGGNRVRIAGAEFVLAGAAPPPRTPLTVGLRPTDAADIAGGGEGAVNRVCGRIADAEFTGADAVVTLVTDAGVRLRLRRSSGPGTAVGDALAVCFSPGDIHVFDQEGRRV